MSQIDADLIATNGQNGWTKFREANQLLDYLLIDNGDHDPQRDPMRFMHKAFPTAAYLAGILAFFESSAMVLKPNGILLLVIASQHVFYSHRQNKLEYIVNGAKLYGELAASRGLELVEEIKIELSKASNSLAKPRAKERYFESVLVFKKVV